jgi:hypothetical protein
VETGEHKNSLPYKKQVLRKWWKLELQKHSFFFFFWEKPEFTVRIFWWIWMEFEDDKKWLVCPKLKYSQIKTVWIWIFFLKEDQKTKIFRPKFFRFISNFIGRLLLHFFFLLLRLLFLLNFTFNLLHQWLAILFYLCTKLCVAHNGNILKKKKRTISSRITKFSLKSAIVKKTSCFTLFTNLTASSLKGRNMWLGQSLFILILSFFSKGVPYLFAQETLLIPLPTHFLPSLYFEIKHGELVNFRFIIVLMISL